MSALLTRNGRRLAAATRRLEPGTRTIEPALPRTAAPGPARLDLADSDGAGVTLKVRDTVRVPRRAG